MILTLDNLATRYNCLPNQALHNATTFDLYVMDIATRWSAYQQQKASGGPDTGRPTPRPSQQDLMAMLQQVRAPAHG